MFGSRSKRHMSPATTLKKRSYKYTHSIESNLPISVPAKHKFGRRHWITHVQDCEKSESSSESSESSESLLLHAHVVALSETPQLLLIKDQQFMHEQDICNTTQTSLSKIG